MFDYIDYSAPCPKCGDKLEGWQSKDGDCLLALLKPHEVRHFYAACIVCGAWVDAEYSNDVVEKVTLIYGGTKEI